MYSSARFWPWAILRISGYMTDTKSRKVRARHSLSPLRQSTQIKRKVRRLFRRQRLGRADDALGGGVVAGAVDGFDDRELASEALRLADASPILSRSVPLTRRGSPPPLQPQAAEAEKAKRKHRPGR
jgi:hypothetical protein